MSSGGSSAGRGLGWSMLGTGLAGGMVWSFAVQAAMPSWFDPGDSCPEPEGASLRVVKTEFPPSAQCVITFDDGSAPLVHDYISPAKTTVLTLVAVVLVLLALAGAALLCHRLLRREGPDTPELPVGRRRPWVHVAGAALLGGIATSVGAMCAAVFTILGGIAGGIVLCAAFVLSTITAATVLDRGAGPGTGGASGPRRRGAAVGGIGGAAVVVAVVTGIALDVLGPSEVLSQWLPLAATLPFGLIAALQWL
ncbi:hypothetical protein, partial [Saccharopolyspora erythraea]